jgi:acyl-CoA synthetase (NDP forming)
MLEARSVAVVGASPKPGSFGQRVLLELDRSPARPEIELVNPRYGAIGRRRCLPSLESIAERVDLVLLCVGDSSLEAQLRLAASRGDKSGVVFGSAVGSDLRHRLAQIATSAGMALCGAGCMGFVNVAKGLRGIGYIEPFPMVGGPIALVTHSGSAFSALLRADRRLAWSVAISSGQELVTTTGEYIDYALSLPETEVVALLLETLHSPATLRASLDHCAAAGVPVVALAVGGSPAGREMVEAHSGALAGDDAMWEALCDAHGVLRVGGLDEMVDTLELLTAGRPLRRSDRPWPNQQLTRRQGVATLHDSGAERTLVVDVAHEIGLPFAELGGATTSALADQLDPGLEAANPLDVWGTGADTETLFGNCLRILAEDEAVQAVALCVDLVPELDGDTAYQDALLQLATPKPVALLTNLPSALDRQAARRLRDAGIPVLEGTRSGLKAMQHLLAFASRADGRQPPAQAIEAARQGRWRQRLRDGEVLGAAGFEMLSEYGIAAPDCRAVASAEEASAAADEIGWPIVLKTAEAVAHKTEAGGVVLGLTGEAELIEAYEQMSGRLGPRALVMATAPAGTELALGIVRDPLVGPMLVVAAGGVLAEVLQDRAVALPPVDSRHAAELLDRLAIAAVLDGARGAPKADRQAIAEAIVSLSQLAGELGDDLAALDINPLRCTPEGVWALDLLAEAAPDVLD